MKRKLIIVIFILLIGIPFYLWFSRDKTTFLKDTGLFQAVPVSSPFFFELNGLDQIAFDHPMLRDMKQSGAGKAWLQLLQKTDSLIRTHDKLPRNLRKSTFIVSFGLAGRNDLFPLIIRKADTPAHQESIELLLQKLYPSGKYTYRKKTYGKNTITEIIPNGKGEPVFYSFPGELFLFSPKSILVEQVLRQLSTPGFLKNPFFIRANNSGGDQKISLFINHEWMGGFFGRILSGEAIEQADEFEGTRRYRPAVLAKKFEQFAGWSKMGIRLEDNQLTFSGISVANDSLSHFLSVFSGQQPVRSDPGEILPRNTSFFCSFSFSDKTDFFQRLESFYTHSQSFYSREERIKRFDKDMRTNTRNVFQKWARNEMTVATTTIPVNPANKTTFFIMQLSDRQAAEDELRGLLKNYAGRTGKAFDQMVSEYSGGTPDGKPVYTFPFPSFPGTWIGSPFALAEAGFITFYNDYMVCSNTREGVQEYIRNMDMGMTLAGDASYQQFIQKQSGRNNLHVYVDVNKAFGFHEVFFTSELREHLKEKEKFIRKLERVSWQVGHEDDLFSNTLTVAYQPEAGKEARAIWQIALGSHIATKPQLVKNHLDPSSREIILQDNNHMLHLVSHTGQVRWSVSLPGPVMGEIHQVDQYKNGRLQYLFNTKEKLYLIDRNGEHVDPFPVSLLSPATNGVNVFDYDHTRNYRYFVAGEDKKIYAYDQAGKIIPGWEFGHTGHRVTTPVQHVRVAGNDYIVFKDQSGIYIQNRRGETRVPVSVDFENSGNPLVFIPGERPGMVTTDTEGQIYFLFFNGQIEKIKTGGFGENHFFTADDLNGDHSPEFIFADGDELTVLDEKGKRIFRKKHDHPIIYPPAVYTFAPNLKKVGVVDAHAGQIYLYQPDGEIHAGFPLPGNNGFSIGRLTVQSEDFSLLVGDSGGNLYHFSLKE